MKVSTVFLVLIIPVTAGESLYASTYEEMNIRQTIENASMNKVIGARLRGMTAGESVRGEIGEATDSVENCSTQIGNLDSDGSLLGGSQDIIIIGDVINICQ